MKSELKIMHGERKGVHVIKHNTNNTRTKEKPRYMPSGLAFSMDMYHINNRKDSNQATMNTMGMERGHMRKEPGTSLPARQQPRSPALLQDKCCCIYILTGQ